MYFQDDASLLFWFATENDVSNSTYILMDVPLLLNKGKDHDPEGQALIIP
jgi:hypothetical protein